MKSLYSFIFYYLNFLVAMIDLSDKNKPENNSENQLEQKYLAEIIQNQRTQIRLLIEIKEQREKKYWDEVKEVVTLFVYILIATLAVFFALLQIYTGNMFVNIDTDTKLQVLSNMVNITIISAMVVSVISTVVIIGTPNLMKFLINRNKSS